MDNRKTKLCVSGMSGFIGSHLWEHTMKTTDWEVVGLVKMDRAGDLNRIQETLNDHPEWASRTKIVRHDLNDSLNSVHKHIGEVDYIAHLAACSHVDTSIADPVGVFCNNARSTVQMLEYARIHQPNLKKFIYFSTDEVYGPAPEGYDYTEEDKLHPSNPYSAGKAAGEMITMAYGVTYDFPYLITNCFSMDMKILTVKGLRGYSEIKKGDSVFTYTDDGNLITTKILEVVKMPSSGEMIEFKSSGVEQLVTPNHRMFVKNLVGSPRREQGLKEELAETFLSFKGRKRVPLTGLWEGKKMSKKYIFGGADEKIMASVYGWFVSEGFLTPDRDNGICFGAGTKWQQEEVIDLLKTISKTTVNGRSVRIYHKEFKKVLKDFGHLAGNKHLPAWIKSLNKDLLQVFLGSAIDGDGHRGKTDLVYHTKSKQLAEDMAEVGMKVGYGVRISKRKTWNPVKTILGESYIVRFKNNFSDLEQHHVRRVPYSGDVWCVRTEVGRVFVERNGAISLSGQTMNVFGERQDPEKLIPKCMKTIQEGGVMTIHGTKGNVGKRHWLHARNAADAVIFLLKDPIVKDKVHIVGDIEMDNLQMYELVAEAMGKKEVVEGKDYEFLNFHFCRPGHDLRYGMSGKKLKGLGWVAPVDFKESLKSTVTWTKEHDQWIK